eukprot:5224514-Pyramimonas_sp.AAC.1
MPRRPRRRAHPQDPHGLAVPRNPRSRTHSRVSKSPTMAGDTRLTKPRDPWRRARPRDSRGHRAPRNPGAGKTQQLIAHEN